MLNIYGQSIQNPLFLGTARYPSLEHIQKSIEVSGAEIVTVSLRRENAPIQNNNQTLQKNFWQQLEPYIKHVLPNTAGCLNINEAVLTAQMARDLFETSWIKLEVTLDEHQLIPNTLALLKACETLCKDNFKVFPYMTTDHSLAHELVAMGCEVLMPWGSMIGSGQGLKNMDQLQSLRTNFPNTTLVIDAGIGKPSHACQAMEMGYDAVLLNTAVATANDPVHMAKAFKDALSAGQAGFNSGLMKQQDFAQNSTPLNGKPFWHYDENK